jgi:serine/threonine protein phosphatase 1
MQDELEHNAVPEAEAPETEPPHPVTVRTYAIGDVHGKRRMLELLLQRIEADRKSHPTDSWRLLFLGDYVDRGEDSRGVLDLLLVLRNRRPRPIFLRGNHEQLMLDALTGSAPEPTVDGRFLRPSQEMRNWLDNGGSETLESYKVQDYSQWEKSVPELHWKFVRETELEFVTDTHHFVHAGLLPPDETWEGAEFGADPRLWIREPFLSSTADFEGRRVIFGHTPQRSGRPLILRNKIGIDTGAFAGGPLTCAVLEEGQKARFLQVPFETEWRPL